MCNCYVELIKKLLRKESNRVSVSVKSCMSLSTAGSSDALQGSHFPVSLDNKTFDIVAISIESSDKIPDDVHILQRQFSQRQPVYFTSDINEGFSNVEEVICDNKPQPPITYIEENQQFPKPYEASPSVSFGTTGKGVQYGHQVGKTSTTVSRDRLSSTECSTESSEESGEEILIATPLIQTQSALKGRMSPFLLSFVDQYDEQSEVKAVNKELADTMPDNDSNDSLYPIISDASNDSIFDNLDSIGIEIDTKSENSSLGEGNIPNLEALGVKEISGDTPVSFVNSSSSTPAKASRSHTSQTVDDFGARNISGSRFFAKRVSSYPMSVRSPESDRFGRRPFRFCTTSTQSAIVEKLSIKQIGTADDDDDSDDKNTILQDIDKDPISSKSRRVESDIDTAYRTSLKQSSMTPLLKEELKLKIQVERMKRGEPEIVLQEEEPKDYGLRPDEIEKKVKRLEQNRKSAWKSRMKSNMYKKQLEKTIKVEMNKATQLRQEIRKLRVFRETLRKELDEHLKVCQGTTRQRSDSK